MHAKLPDPIDKHVGARVRMQRMMLSMSQEKLAAGLGITFQQVQKYEKGTNRISASRLQQIAAILGVPVHFFFDGAPGSSESNHAATDELPYDQVLAFVTSADGLALVRAFTRIKYSALRRSIVQMVQAMDEDRL